VTPVRLERGEQSPRYETLVGLARGLGRPVGELLASE
jgi:transcriptional regulator with XRE-family HTH domain